MCPGEGGYVRHPTRSEEWLETGRERNIINHHQLFIVDQKLQIVMNVYDGQQQFNNKAHREPSQKLSSIHGRPQVWAKPLHFIPI